MKYKGLIIIILIIGHSLKSFTQDDIYYPEKDTLPHSYIKPIISTLAFNILINRIDANIRNKEWAKVSPSSWWKNLKRGFMTDGDGFPTNWFQHPMHGAWYYNSARHSGLNYWQSLPYTLGGSLIWEYFGETEPPSEIDLYTTTLGGIYMGELFFRFADYLYNYPFRKNRKFNKVAAQILNPYFGIKSLLFGYEIPRTVKSKTPVSALFLFGTNYPLNSWIREMNTTGTILDLDLVYGELTNENDSKFGPFDYFSLRSWLNFTTVNGSLEWYFNLMSDAVLYGKKLKNNNDHMEMISISQHYNFVHNTLFKLGSLGLTTDYWLHRKIGNLNITGALKGGLLLFGSGNSELVQNDFPEIFPGFVRDYVYGHGLMAEGQISVNLLHWGTIVTEYDFFRIYSRDIPGARENLQLYRLRYLKPIRGDFSFGLEYNWYQRNATYPTNPISNLINNSFSEGRILIAYNL